MVLVRNLVLPEVEVEFRAPMINKDELHHNHFVSRAAF